MDLALEAADSAWVRAHGSVGRLACLPLDAGALAAGYDTAWAWPHLETTAYHGEARRQFATTFTKVVICTASLPATEAIDRPPLPLLPGQIRSSSTLRAFPPRPHPRHRRLSAASCCSGRRCLLDPMEEASLPSVPFSVLPSVMGGPRHHSPDGPCYYGV